MLTLPLMPSIVTPLFRHVFAAPTLRHTATFSYTPRHATIYDAAAMLPCYCFLI